MTDLKKVKIKIPRVANKGIKIPQGVDFKQEQDVLIFSAKEKEVRRFIPGYISVRHEQNTFWLSLQETNASMLTRKEQRTRRSELGTFSSLLQADVEGIVTPFVKILELVGVGYKAESHKDGLKLSVGYSHDVICPLPEGVELSVEKPTLFKLLSRDKELLGRTVSGILAIRKIEPYKGKGVRIQGQYVRMKQGKTK